MSDRYHLVCGDVLRPRPTVTRGLFWGKVHGDVCVCVNEPLGFSLGAQEIPQRGPSAAHDPASSALEHSSSTVGVSGVAGAPGEATGDKGREAWG